MFRRATLLIAACAALAACRQEPPADLDRPETAREFPRAYRPVSETAGNDFSTEQARDDRNEANTVMDLANIRAGMTVADIGAGEGYYTVRLAERVGSRGRVLAQDIDQDALRRWQPGRGGAARQCLDQARRGRRSAAAGEQLRPRVPGPYVPRGNRALRLPVAAAAGAARGRTDNRRRCGPSRGPTWVKTPIVVLRVSGSRFPTGGICSQAGTRGVLCAVRSDRPATGSGRDRAVR